MVSVAILINFGNNRESVDSGRSTICSGIAPGLACYLNAVPSPESLLSSLDGNTLEVVLPRDVFGESVDVEIKWEDNLNRSDDIMDFYTCGDAAPGDGSTTASASRTLLSG